jgi:hypothetical protein
MRFFILFLMAPSLSCAMRTLGEIAHPNAQYRSLLSSIRDINNPTKRAQYIVDAGLHGSGTIGLLATNEKRTARFMKSSRAVESMMLDAKNIDKPGRDFQVGYLPHIAYANVLQALVANSDVLTPRDMFDAIDEARKQPCGGAWLYAPLLPRFKEINQKILPISAHIDNYFVPTNGQDPWWMTSLVNPTATGNVDVINLLKEAGYERITPSPVNSLVEKLCAGEPPNPETGNWNFLMTGGFDEFSKSLTTGKLFATVLGVDEVPYEATFIPKIWLSNEQYQNVCAIRILERISKSKSPSYPLSLGIHSALNSCAHLTNTLFNPTDTYKCEPLEKVYMDTIDRSAAFWLTKARGKELIDFFQSGDDDFRSIPRSVAKNYVSSLLKSPSLSSNRPGRSTYKENYSNCATPHPDPDAAAFYEECAETMIELMYQVAFQK